MPTNTYTPQKAWNRGRLRDRIKLKQKPNDIILTNHTDGRIKSRAYRENNHEMSKGCKNFSSPIVAQTHRSLNLYLIYVKYMQIQCPTKLGVLS